MNLPSKFFAWKSFHDLIDAQDQWDQLVDQVGLAPDHYMDWMRVVWENVGAHRSLRIGTTWKGDRLQAVAPVVFETQRRKGLTVSVIQCLASYNQLHGSQFIVSDGSAPSLFDEVFDGLDNGGGSWHLMFIRYGKEEPQRRLFEEALRRRGYPFLIREDEPSPYLMLCDTWEAQLRGLRKKFRYELRTREKALRERGVLEIRFMNTPSLVAEGLECIREIEGASWKAGGGFPITHPFHWGFYTRYAEVAAENGRLCLPIMFLNDEPVAFDYAVLSNGIYYLLQTSYKSQWSEYSPGTVLRKLVIEWLCGLRVSQAALGSGASLWKAKWTAESRQYRTYTVFNRGWKARYLYWFGRAARAYRGAMERLRAIEPRTQHQP